MAPGSGYRGAVADPDLIFTGGPILSDDPADSVVAVRGGRVVAVGGPELLALRGPRTEVVELGGRLLIPGFQDAHVHAVMGGVELGQCDLTGTTELGDYERRIRAYAKGGPAGGWIVGGGWSMESFPGGLPARGLLDRIAGDRPVYLANRDHHAAWVNSRALELAGITARTPDPADGRIDREPDGSPAGSLQEGAMALVAAHVPEPTPADRLAGLLRGQRLLHSLGVTAWQDAMLCATNGYPDLSDAYLTAATDGTLVSAVTGALWWDRERGLDQVAELVAKRERFSAGRLRSGTIKIMLDGIAENFTAAMTSPYRDGHGQPTGNSGLSFIDPAALREYVTALDALDFQVHFHALGDRAVREALDAVAAARAANGRRDTRHHLAHLQVVHADDIGRFQALGAAANLQALWATHEPQMDELTIPFLDPALAGRQYPFAELHRAGAMLAAGSDWPVSSPDPIQGIHVAVNRALPGSGAPAFLPEQALSLRTALDAYTKGSAFVSHRDDSGRLAAGCVADLVVLDRDPFAGPAAEIGSTRVALTYIGGELVHET
jgi:predicted amidohydrolase YtcJ